MSKAISTGPIFTMFYQMEGICVSFLDPVHFFPIPQGTLPWQPILFGTGLDRFSQSLHHMVGIELQMITSFYFF